MLLHYFEAINDLKTSESNESNLKNNLQTSGLSPQGKQVANSASPSISFSSPQHEKIFQNIFFNPKKSNENFVNFKNIEDSVT